MKKKFLVIVILVISIISMICSIVYATDENTNNADLPASYDLRNDIDIRVESQGQRSWCNVYSYIKMIETYLQKTKGINYNLSEAYVAYSNAPYFGGQDEELTSLSKINNSSVDVSNIIEKNALVLESDFPNKNYPFNTTSREKFDNAKVVIKSFKVEYLSKSEEIKQYIMEKGAVKIIAYGEDSKANAQWKNSSGTINCKKNEDDSGYGHAVVIIGWDDNYSRNNFNASCRPENDGAWLILNSWGTDWGNKGTAWVSYEDEWFIEQLEYCYGVKSIKIPGEPPIAQFTYRIVDSITAEAYIETDENVEYIEGWSGQKNRFYKTIVRYSEPFTVKIHSPIDNTETTVEINVPEEDFAKKQEEIEKQKDEENKREKELEQIRKKSLSYKIDMLIIILPFIFIIFILVLLTIKKHKKKKDTENVIRKKINSRKIIILILFIFILTVILGI